jgi:hypothetical protein
LQIILRNRHVFKVKEKHKSHLFLGFDFKVFESRKKCNSRWLWVELMLK